MGKVITVWPITIDNRVSNNPSFIKRMYIDIINNGIGKANELRKKSIIVDLPGIAKRDKAYAVNAPIIVAIIAANKAIRKPREEVYKAFTTSVLPLQYG